MKKIYFLSIIILMLILTGCTGNPTYETYSENNINSTVRIYENRFQIYKDGNWEDFIVKGVNLLPSKPNNSEISEREYYKWIEDISKMNANTIRIYHIYPEEFYEALDKFNKKNKDPIYLLQGVSPDEEMLKAIPDAFKLDNIVPFKEEIKLAVDTIYNNPNIPPYLLGWILGMEWEPEMVDNVNNTRVDKGDYDGKYVFTEEARPFEHFLADIFDYTLTYEIDKYGWQHPISFINWTSTDILRHSYEPVKEQDMISINPDLIKLKENGVGQFATYHIYPYYPEFLNLDPKYTMHIDHRGKTNNFAGYVRDLISVHNMPLLIAEFGVPSSRGLEQVSVHGLNKGYLSEKQQGEYISSMFEDIVHEGALGGVISYWQDNWSNWSDAQKADENFGIISFHRDKIKVDGNIKDWKSNKITPLFSSDKKDENIFKNIYMDNDERYLYFGIEYKDLKSNLVDTVLLLDTISNQGNRTNPFNKNIITENGSDFIINIKDGGTSRILLDSYYDLHYFKYNKFISEKNPDFNVKGNEIYHPIKSVIREEITSFRTGQKIPFMNYETGVLKAGNGNPESSDFDSLADYFINKDKNFIELRIPWSLLGFKEPDKKIIQGDFHVDGIDSILSIDDIKVTVCAYLSDDIDTYYRSPEIIYTWNNWDSPVIEERFKESYSIIKETFSKY